MSKLTAFIAAAVWAPVLWASPPSLVLVTLDTTRADHLGCYGASAARTPVLDGLAARGTRYARALTSSPLTLPAHASLMTGLEPPEHGVRDNGTASLAADVPTLAAALVERGYTTGAFVASRVLDRRFGLGRGFATYDDRMAAEQVGQYGYPERDAAAVTASAVDWLGGVRAPYFLWVHYYDPHAPYEPPPELRGGSREADYAGEIAYVDREVGRLLAALPAGERVIAVVGDHGEGLGEHGEDGHGIFLYRAALEVPLILAGPGIPVGRVVEETVATRRLAATLTRLLGAAGLPGAALPGLPPLGDDPAPRPVYSEARLPASAYGWAPLTAFSDDRWRLVVAPRPELYDFVADPAEARNLIGERRDEARRLKAALAAYEAGFERRAGGDAPADPGLAADLRSLGYLGGTSGREGTMDPKDGILLLAELEDAKRLLQAGNVAPALAILRRLASRNPGNVPFLTHLAGAQMAAGEAEAALATYRRAIRLNPGLHLLYLNLAEACRHLGRLEEARAAYRRVLELEPRSAGAWLSLAEFAARAGDAPGERRLLEEGVAAGTASAAIRIRLGQIAAAAGETSAADDHYRTATELAPGWPLAWLLWGRLAASRDRSDEARVYLGKAAALAPDAPEGREARRLLEALY